MTRTYATNLRCAGCIGSIAPHFNAAPDVASWSVDVSQPGKPLSIQGVASPQRVAELLALAGYQSLGELPSEPRASATGSGEDPVADARGSDGTGKTTYFPLALLVGFLLGGSLLLERGLGTFDANRAMRHFMAAFFLAFSFFKLLDVRAFADSFAMYDLLATRSRPYALAYPFIELLLGVLYLANVAPFAVNAATLVVMLLGASGVLNSMIAGRRIRCACLGAVFNLPMSSVTLAEDLAMAGMAAIALVAH